MDKELDWYLKDLAYFSEEIGKLKEQNKEEESKLKEKTIDCYEIKVFNLKHKIKKRFSLIINENV